MPPTHKVVDIDIIVVHFPGDMIAGERIDRDRATVRRRVGPLDD